MLKRTNNILVLGYFGYATNKLDGQTVKTRNVFELLKINCNNLASIDYFDTHQFQKTNLYLFIMIWKILRCNKLVYMPADDNLKYLFPFIYIVCKYKRIDIIFIVIGGWLDDFLKTSKLHANLLSKISVILSESKQLNNNLKHIYNINNAKYFPNFRIQSFIPSFKKNKDSFNIIYMGRINQMKGIDSIFRLAKYIEVRHNSDHAITIDFFGPIEYKEKNYFLEQINKFQFVSYKGIIMPENIYKTLDRYDVLVLPTKYYGEGFPGSILDAYISGIPVIVSNWKWIPEHVEEGKTGYVFDLNREQELYNYVENLYMDRNLLLKMKRYAYEKSKEYSSEIAWNIIRDYLIPK